MGKHLSAFCIHCQEKTLHIKKTPNHVLHLLLTILTAGLWLIVWILVGMSSASEKWQCSKCGTPITAKDRVEKNAKKKLISSKSV